MKAILYVVVKGSLQDVRAIQEILKKRISDISFSPDREQPSLNDCIEFYASFQIEKDQLPALECFLNNDWTGDSGDLESYGFNTKMFDSQVYYLRLQYD